MGLTPAMPRPDARWMGSGLHIALAEWYMPEGAKDGFARGRDPRETFSEYASDAWATVAVSSFADEATEQEYIDSKVLGVEMLGNYMDFYEGYDPTVEVIFPEYRYAAKIPFNKRQVANGYKDELNDWRLSKFGPDIARSDMWISIMVGTFDMVFRDQVDGFVKLMDHKSAKQRTSGAHLTKDDQGGTYLSIATNVLRRKNILGPKQSVAGMVFNYLKKARIDPDMILDERGVKRNQPNKQHYADALAARGIGVAAELMKLSKPKLEEIAKGMPSDFVVYGEISKIQPSPLFWREDVRRSRANQLHQISRIADDTEMIDHARAGELPIMKNPGDHCGWCDFRDLCDVDEDGADTKGFIDAMFVSRDMYADHHDGAENSKLSVVADKSVKSNVTKVDFGGFG